MRRRWDYTVKVFAGPRHHRGAPAGSLLIETTHQGKPSRDMELWATLSLMTKYPGSYDRVEIIAHCDECWVKTIHEYEAQMYLTKDTARLRPGAFTDVERS